MSERCASYMTNFKYCGKTATHIERCPNGVEYLCNHHAQMRQKQGGQVEGTEEISVKPTTNKRKQ